MKKVGIIVAILAVLAAAGGGAYYYFTNTPKNLFLLSEKKSLEDYSDYSGDRFGQELDFQEKTAKEAYSNVLKLAVDVPESLLEEYGIPTSLLDSTSIEFVQGHDPKAKKSEVSFTPTIGGGSTDAFTWFSDDKAQYVKAPLFNDTLMVKNDEMESAYEKLIGEPAPKEFDLKSLNLNKLMESNVTTEDLNDIQGRYIKVIVDSLENDQFEEKDAKTKIFDKEQELKAVTMTMEKADVQRVGTNIVKELRKDKDVKKIYDSAVGVYGEQSYDSLLDDLQKEVDNVEIDKVVATNYIDGKDVLKRNIVVTQKGKDLFTIDATQQFDNGVKIDATLVDEDGMVVTLKGASTGKDDAKDEYTLAMEASDETGSPFSVVLKNESTLKDLERKGTMNVIVNDEGDTELFTAAADYTTVTDEKNNKQTSKADITFPISNENVVLHYDANTTLKAKLDFDTKNAKDLNALSEAESQEIQENLLTNVFTIVDQLNLQDVFGGY